MLNVRWSGLSLALFLSFGFLAFFQKDAKTIGVALFPSATPMISGKPATPPPTEKSSPGMVATPDRLARPVLPANPSQADLGAQTYYLVCMTCHGDRGQGLTQEWIDAWHLDEKDSCWQSKCHAANHPPEGFVLPKTIPAVTGPSIAARFATGLDLHNYIREKMPWQAPGTLTEDQYWQLTAYVLRLNGFDPRRTALNETTALQIRLRPEPTPTVTTTPLVVEFVSQNWYWLGAIGMMLIAGVFFLVKYISGKPG